MSDFLHFLLWLLIFAALAGLIARMLVAAGLMFAVAIAFSVFAYELHKNKPVSETLVRQGHRL